MTQIALAVPAQLEFHQAHLARKRRMNFAVRKALKPPEREWKQQFDAHVIARSHHVMSQYRTVDVIGQKQTAHGLMRAFFVECPYSKADLFSDSRQSDVVVWRHALIHLLYENLALSLPMLGRMIGGRDHTTILHALRKVNAAIGEGRVRRILLSTGHTIYVRHKVWS